MCYLDGKMGSKEFTMQSSKTKNAENCGSIIAIYDRPGFLISNILDLIRNSKLHRGRGRCVGTALGF